MPSNADSVSPVTMATNTTWLATTTMGPYSGETPNVSGETLGPPGLAGNAGGTGTTSHPVSDLTPLGLIGVVIVATVANLTVCVVVKMDRRLHHMTFYFFVSMAVVHLLMAGLVMPPAVLVVVAGTFEYSEELCKLWVTLDLFFCNNICLHLAFTNMDTFLRLKDPLRHGRIVTTCSVVLWIGAPWMISLVQAIAQFMLSQGDHGIIHSGVCFIADKNFVILGTLFSFLIPTIISILFYCLCVCEIRALKHGKFLEESEGSQNVYRYASNESLPEELSDTTSCLSDTQCDTTTTAPEQVQLAVVTNMKEGEVKECVSNSPHNSSLEETTSFCDDHALSPCAGDHANNNAATNFMEHILSTDQSASCTLLLRESHTEGVLPETLIRPNAEVDHSSPDENLRHEQAISRLMFLLLICCIALWVPFSASNVVYGVCRHCRANMAFDEMSTFKWLAYSTAVLGPFIYVKFSEPMRDAYCKLFSCLYCRRCWH